MSFYTVTIKNTGEKVIVEAGNRTQAYRTVGNMLLDVAVAKASDVVKHVESGKKVLRDTKA